MLPNKLSDVPLYFLILILAMALRITPFMESLSFFNPDWVLLILIYWSLAAPERFGVFNAWFTGLLTDVLTARLLGQYALVYSLIVYICIRFHKRIRHYPLPQQCLYIFLCLLLSQMIVFWIEAIKAANRLPLAFWLPIFSGTLLWPLLHSLLNHLRIFRRF